MTRIVFRRSLQYANPEIFFICLSEYRRLGLAGALMAYLENVTESMSVRARRHRFACLAARERECLFSVSSRLLFFAVDAETMATSWTCTCASPTRSPSISTSMTSLLCAGGGAVVCVVTHMPDCLASAWLFEEAMISPRCVRDARRKLGYVIYRQVIGTLALVTSLLTGGCLTVFSNVPDVSSSFVLTRRVLRGRGGCIRSVMCRCPKNPFVCDCGGCRAGLVD